MTTIYVLAAIAACIVARVTYRVIRQFVSDLTAKPSKYFILPIPYRTRRR